MISRTVSLLAALAVAATPATAAAATTERHDVTVVERVGTELEVRTETVASAAAAERLADDPGVVAVAPETSFELYEDPYQARQWALEAVHAEPAWLVTEGAGVVVAVVDSGVDGTHEDLQGRLVQGYDAVAGTPGGTVDVSGHGTAVAGIIAAGRNGVGMVGLAPAASIMPIAVQKSDRTITSTEVIAGIEWAVEHGADVINLSLGSDQDNAALHAVIQDAVAQNVVVVAASGNQGWDESKLSYPAAYDEVIAVGATDVNGDRARFAQGSSNTGPHVDLAAPGLNVTVTATGGGYAQGAGTSFASPYVAAAAAMVRAAHPQLSQADVRAQLEATATDLGSPGRDDEFGAGQINALVALGGVVVEPQPVPEPELEPEPEPTSSPRPQPEPTRSPEPEPEPEPSPEPEPEPVRSVRRLGTDPDVAATAVQLSRDAFPDEAGASIAVLSRDDAFADSLAGTALAGSDGPILFTTGGPDAPLRPDTAAELSRVLVPGGEVVVLGGTNAVSTAAEQAVAALGYPVRRIAGASRFETALFIADAVDPDPDQVLLARADTWADAVTGGAYAASRGVPVLLTGSDSLHPAVAESLQRTAPAEVVLLGGTAALSDGVAAAAGATRRVSGATRAGTAASIAADLWGRTGAADGDTFVAVEGWDASSWAPALAGAVLSAVLDAPQLLFDGGSPVAPDETAAYLDRLGYGTGEAASAVLVGPRLTDAHIDEVAGLLGR